MIELNLLPEELRKKEMPKLALPQVPVKGQLAAIAVFLGIHVLFVVGAIYRQIDLLSSKSEVDRLRVANRGIMQQKAEITVAQARGKQIDAIITRKFYWTQLLNSLSDVTVKGVWLTQFSVSDKNESMRAKSARSANRKGAKARTKDAPDSARFFKIEGNAVGSGQETAIIGKFIKEIKQNGFFAGMITNVELSTINQRRIRDVDVYDFLLEVPLKSDKVDFS